MKIGITGITGYVGRHVAKYLQNNTNNRVVALHPYQPKNKLYDQHRNWTLNTPTDVDKIDDLNSLVHFAYDYSATTVDETRKNNIAGTVSLMQAARSAGVNNRIHISSLAAHSKTRSLYGYTKIAIESQLDNTTTVVRPGLVYGNDFGSTIQKLNKLITSFPFIPRPIGTTYRFTCHYDDIAQLIIELLNGTKNFEKPIIAASESGIRFRDLVYKIAKHNNTFAQTIPVPISPIALAVHYFEKTGITFPISSDNLYGLAYPNQNPDFSITEKIETRFQDFQIK